MEFQLRRWRVEDAKDVSVSANNEKIAKNLRNTFPYPYTLEDARGYVKSCVNNDESRQICRAIEVDDKVIGSIGIFLGNDVYEKSGELGYWLSEDYWNKGIVSLAAKQLCKEAFDRFDLVRIYAEPFEHNMGSRKALEKAGFTLEGIMRNGVCKNGEIFGYCMYAILKEELGY